MSFKRKTTKPIRVSEVFQLSSQSAESKSFTETGQTQISIPHIPSTISNETEDPYNGSDEEPSWQVNITLPRKPRDLPTMVSSVVTINSKWHVTPTYSIGSTDDNSFDTQNKSPLTNGQHSDPLISDSSTSLPPPKKTRKIRYKYHENCQVKYKCDVCHYCTNRSDHYKRHLMTHSEEKPLKCLSCGYGTGRSDHFKRHLIRHGLSKEEINYQCDYNGIRSATNNNTRHTNPFGSLQPGNDPTTQKIQHTAVDLTNPSIRRSQLPSDQAMPKKFSCEICGYSTDRNSHYTRHVRTHSDELPHTCDACGKRFKLATYLKKHRCPMKQKPPSPSNLGSEPDKSLSCCPSTVPPYDVITSNNALVDGSSGRVCMTCGMTFEQQSDLSTHTCHNLMETI